MCLCSRTLTVLGNVYSVPSRLIGRTLMVRVRAEQLEGSSSDQTGGDPAPAAWTQPACD